MAQVIAEGRGCWHNLNNFFFLPCNVSEQVLPFRRFCARWGDQSGLRAAEHQKHFGKYGGFYNCLLNNCWEQGLATAWQGTYCTENCAVCPPCVCARVCVSALASQLASAAGTADSEGASAASFTAFHKQSCNKLWLTARGKRQNENVSVNRQNKDKKESKEKKSQGQ